ncbi:MAG: SH3 domain-containing protein [Flexilinea sp.]
MLPNDAQICHYCGMQQAEKEAFQGKKFSRCPQCMSYLYSEKNGCQTCGYVPVTNKSFTGLLILISLLLLGGFVLWQLGLIPGLPNGGKAAKWIISESGIQPEGSKTPQLAAVESTQIKDGDEDRTLTNPITELTGTLATPAELSAQRSASPIAPSIIPEPVFCGNLSNRLTEGMHGKIISGGRSSKVRQEPSTESRVITIITSDQTFIVLNDDAVCNGGYSWIKISIPPENMEGWTVESDGSDYWLMETTNDNES